MVWDHEVAGSNPVTPTIFLSPRFSMFCVYVLRSAKTGRCYVGHCEDLDDRLRRHNAGESKATKHGVPWSLVHVEEFSTRSAAMARERYYKTGRGRDELNQLLERSPRRQVAGSNPVTPTTPAGNESARSSAFFRSRKKHLPLNLPWARYIRPVNRRARRSRVAQW